MYVHPGRFTYMETTETLTGYIARPVTMRTLYTQRVQIGVVEPA